MELSLRWAERARAAFARRAKPGQALFAIVQGGVDADLRRRSAEALVAMDFPGYAVGGLAVDAADLEKIVGSPGEKRFRGPWCILSVCQSNPPNPT